MAVDEEREVLVQESRLSLGQQISAGAVGKRKDAPKNTVTFKEAVQNFKSKDELYFTLAVRGKNFEHDMPNFHSCRF